MHVNLSHICMFVYLMFTISTSTLQNLCAHLPHEHCVHVHRIGTTTMLVHLIRTTCASTSHAQGARPPHTYNVHVHLACTMRTSTSHHTHFACLYYMHPVIQYVYLICICLAYLKCTLIMSLPCIHDVYPLQNNAQCTFT